jgi:hypothetical protein
MSNCNCILSTNKNKIFISAKVHKKHLHENLSVKKDSKILGHTLQTKNNSTLKKYSKKIFIIKKMKKRKLINNKNKSQNNLHNSSLCMTNKQTNPSYSSFDSLKIHQNLISKQFKIDLIPNTFIQTASTNYDTSCQTNTSQQNIDKMLDNIFSFKEKNKHIIMTRIVL